jgi:4-hydroxybenzoate polyprenyltransferase
MKSLIRKANLATQITQVISPPRASLLTYLKAVRIHQWMKNLLVLVPLFAAHQADNLAALIAVLAAFFAFGFCASAVYLLNDMLDLEADREHVRKRNRPFASGAIPLLEGAILVPLLLASSLSLCYVLPPMFGAVLGFYFLLTLLYSFWLKRQVIVDVLLLAGLYTLRIIAGAAAVSIVPSFWLLAFSMFIFLSLAIVKRYSELSISLKNNKTKAAGRGYSIEDLPVLASLGAAAGMAGVMVLALYINDPETLKNYPSKLWLWLAPPLLLYWVSRLWLKTCRGEIDDDPVVFAVKDWQSLLSGGILAMCFYLSSAP